MIGQYVISGYLLMPETVEIIEDKTHEEWGFRTGTMNVIGSDGCSRWIQFGLYNYHHAVRLDSLCQTEIPKRPDCYIEYDAMSGADRVIHTNPNIPSRDCDGCIFIASVHP